MALIEHCGKKGADLSTLRIDSEDEHSAQGSSIMLPPELLSLVCELLPKQALKQVRQVSGNKLQFPTSLIESSCLLKWQIF